MRLAISLMAAAAAVASAGAASAATVEVRDAVAHVTVIPEDRSDIKVEILSSNPQLPLQVSAAGRGVLIDGGLRRRISGCDARLDHPEARVRGVGHVSGAALPKVVIRTPRQVTLVSSGAVFGEIGRAASLDLRDSGCSAWTIADVAGEAAVHEAGESTVRMGSAGRLDLHLSGAAHIRAVQARQSLSAEISGAGRVEVEDAAGPVEADVSGIGKVRVAHGHASMIKAGVSGVGSMEFDGVADELRATISGMGSVHVNQVTGALTKSVSGIGHVTVGERPS